MVQVEWPTKIKHLRRGLGLSQEQLAGRLAVTKKTVAEWEQGRQALSPERTLQLARLAPRGQLRRWFTRHALARIGAEPYLVLDAFRRGRRARPSQALPGTAELRVVALAGWPERFRALEGLDHYVAIPLLKAAAAAGSPREVSDADIDGYALIHYPWCPNPENYTCLRVRGDSMTPILHDGAIVAVDHSQCDPFALNHKLVAARHDGGVTIKWLESHPGGELRLVPENKSYPALTLPRTPENPILGMVAWWWNRQR